MKPKERGSAELLGMLVVCAITMILLAAAVPSIIKGQRVQNEQAAAQQLSQIAAAEFVSAQVYGQYVPPAQLAQASLSQPLSCANPFLLSGQQVNAPDGYSLTFAPGSSVTGPNCTSTPGFSNYSISLDPSNTLQAQRHFFLSSSDGAIHYASGRSATISDPVMPASVVNGATVMYSIAGGGGGTNPTGPSVTAPLTTPYSGMMTFNGNGVCTISNFFHPFAQVGNGDGSDSITGTVTLDALGNIVASSFPNGVQMQSGQFVWTNSQLSDYGWMGNSAHGTSVVNIQAENITFSNYSTLFFTGGVATFSANFQSFTWSGTMGGAGAPNYGGSGCLPGDNQVATLTASFSQ
jgi:competence protein ComGC